MELIDKAQQLTGILHLRVLDVAGVEVWADSAKNLIVSGGYNIAARALAGVEGYKLAKIAVGTNATQPVESDSQITDAVVLAVESVEYPRAGTVRFNFTVGYNDAVGMPVREFGLLADNGQLFSRKVRETIDKTQHMTIVGAWEITF